MAQLSNRERERLKFLLTEKMDEIEGRLDERLEQVKSEIKSDINSVRSEVINILGLDEEQPSTPTQRSVSPPIGRSRTQGRIPS